MAYSSIALSSFRLLLLLPLSLSLLLLASADGGFTAELIHRDSPKSPLYDPSKTFVDRIRENAHLSIIRARHLSRALSPTATGATYQSTLAPNSASYLMPISIGTPAHEIVAIADTGSDLVWTDCVPCKSCYPQNAPLFDPTKSSSYRDLSCAAKECALIGHDNCTSDGATCQYSYGYGGGSQTRGNLATETFTFNTVGGSPVQIPNVAFGCSHNTAGGFTSATAGLIGLGGGPLSLVTQLGSVIDQKLSYCLVPYTQNSISSKINFGSNAVVSDQNAVSTPLIEAQQDTFFTVSLQSLIVDGETIQANSTNIIFDSGTTLTLLPPTLLQSLGDKLTKIINLPRVQNSYFSFCFNVSNSQKVQFPDITFQFDGAAFTLGSLNTFIELSDDKSTVCLAIVGNQDIAIVGNIAQQNFHIGYDLENRKLTFAPADCTKF